jgi:hypothetical protein
MIHDRGALSDDVTFFQSDFSMFRLIALYALDLRFLAIIRMLQTLSI